VFDAPFFLQGGYFMDVAKAFTFVTEDEQWVGKIGIGAIIALGSILILPIPLLLGYQVGVTRNVMKGVDRPLPQWEEFGQLFSDGLSILVAQIVYTLPFWLVVCIALFSTVGLSGLTDAVSEDLLTAGFLATWGLVMCLSLIFVVVWFFLSPAIVIQYVRTNSLAACFRFGEVVAIVRENVSDIVIAGLAAFGATLALNIVVGGLSIIPCLGQIVGVLLLFAGSPWLLATMGHLYGQIAAGETTAF
jgi:hypothetical protein